MPSLKDTEIQIIEIVMPQHTNPLDTLHGGQMMEWLVNVGTLAATRVAKGPVVLGAIDDVDFVNAVLANEIVVLEAQVHYIGTSSIEVGARVTSEQPYTGITKLTTSCHLSFVSVDAKGRPRPVSTNLNPNSKKEQGLFQAAKVRNQTRRSRLATQIVKELSNITPRHRPQFTTHSVRSVLPEDATHSDLMFGGRLLKHLDELGAILCMRYSKGVCVTASLDALEFYNPIRVGDILVSQADLNYVGKTSLEVGIKTLIERPWENEIKHGCTAFLTYVHLGENRHPQPITAFSPKSREEKKVWKEAEDRRKNRVARAQALKASYK